MNNLSHDSLSAGWGSKLGRPKYEMGEFNTQPRCLVKTYYLIKHHAMKAHEEVKV
jgi:hypothetical protein